VKNFVNAYGKFVQKAVDLCGYIAGALLFIPALSITYEVLMRGLLNQPTEWAIEVSTYCVVIAGFLGMPHAYSAGKHINVDIVISKLTDRTRCMLQVITSAAGTVFCFLLCVKGFQMSMLSLELNNLAPSTLQTPLWIPQASLPIGFALLTLQFLGTFLKDICKLQDGAFAADGSLRKDYERGEEAR